MSGSIFTVYSSASCLLYPSLRGHIVRKMKVSQDVVTGAEQSDQQISAYLNNYVVNIEFSNYSEEGYNIFRQDRSISFSRSLFPTPAARKPSELLRGTPFVPTILMDSPPDGSQLVTVLPNDLDLSKFGNNCRVIMNVFLGFIYLPAGYTNTLLPN